MTGTYKCIRNESGKRDDVFHVLVHVVHFGRVTLPEYSGDRKFRWELIPMLRRSTGKIEPDDMTLLDGQLVETIK